MNPEQAIKITGVLSEATPDDGKVPLLPRGSIICASLELEHTRAVFQYSSKPISRLELYITFSPKDKQTLAQVS